MVAGIAMNVIDWAGFLLRLYQERLLDWAAVIIYGRLPITTGEILFAQLGQIFFAGILGTIFSSFLLKWTSENYLIKGWFYGILVWFSIYALSTILRIPTLAQHTFNTVVSHFISGSVYGLVLPYTLNWLDKEKVNM